MPAISGNPSLPQPPVNPQGPISVQQVLQARGDSDWHFELDQAGDKSQAETLLKGFSEKLAGQPGILTQLAQLPHGQALIESLEAAANGQLRPEHVRALQNFLSQTAGIDISYGGSDGCDGLLGPRTLSGLNELFSKLEQGVTPTDAPTGTSTASPAAGTVSQYLNSLELAAREPRTPVLPSLSLFSDTEPGSMYERSPYHDENKFVPRFAMTAFHESGVYRSPKDPYAVGAISRPRKRDDLGGKTYGSYQFESSVHTDGSRPDATRVANSTLARFLRWSGNPYGPALREAADRHGIGSAAFDQVWAQLARDQNKLFGEAQQAFMLSERTASVQSFMNRADLSPEVKADSRIQDLIMGTTNHVGGLASSAAEHLARLQREAGRKFTANEAGRALAEYKQTQIASWFQSSPGAWDGIRNRFQDERSQFA